jgi:hypothetical protein
MKKPKMTKLAPAVPPPPAPPAQRKMTLEERVYMLEQCVNALIDEVGPPSVIARVNAAQKARAEAAKPKA